MAGPKRYRGTDAPFLFQISGEDDWSFRCLATTRFEPQRRHSNLDFAPPLIVNLAHPAAMTDRAAKRLRRLSTGYDDSEDNVEWKHSRYVACIPSNRRQERRPLRQGSCSETQAASWGASKQPAAGSSASSQCHDLSPPPCATRVNPCAHPTEGNRHLTPYLLLAHLHHTL